MVYPKNRSNSVRTIKVRTAKGLKLHFERKKKGKKHYCGLCGAILAGTSNARSVSKSMRTPTRKFGGHLCLNCAKSAIKAKTRLADGSVKIEDVDIQLKRYVK